MFLFFLLLRTFCVIFVILTNKIYKTKNIFYFILLKVLPKNTRQKTKINVCPDFFDNSLRNSENNVTVMEMWHQRDRYRNLHRDRDRHRHMWCHGNGNGNCYNHGNDHGGVTGRSRRCHGNVIFTVNSSILIRELI